MNANIPEGVVGKTLLELKVEVLEKDIADLKVENLNMKETIDRIWDEIHAIGRRMK